METFLTFTFAGLFAGAAYSVAASGVVLTYSTTRVFNLAHGATAMLMAYLYWQLHVGAHMQSLLAALIVMFVFAPIFGIIMQKFVMKGLGDAPVGVSLVVTLGLFVLLIGLAQQFWPSTNGISRSFKQFFGYAGFVIGGKGGYNLSYFYIITILLSGAVAGGLYFLLYRTRTGTAMRAAVDNAELLQLFGSSSDRVQMASWATGTSLAALAGILLVAGNTMDYFGLTFLVMNSFAAALFGRLQSLPMTFAGAMGLGLLTAYFVGYGPHGSVFSNIQASLPIISMLVILIFMPQVRLRVGQVKGILAANVPSGGRSLRSAGGFAVAVVAALPLLSAVNTERFGTALVFAIVMLSLVLLTGYGGYVSLAQLSFVGVGAVVVAKMNTGSPVAVVIAVLVSAAVGALVALPVLRLTGLYLALATLSFGLLMDNLLFGANFMFGFGGSLNAKRMSLFGVSLHNNKVYILFLAVVFALIGVGILAVRRGPIGRLLIAMRDSPAACGTLGLNMQWFRIGLFSASAGIAGLAGALGAGLTGIISAPTFATFQSLLVLLLAVVAGATTITGAFLGGLMLMLLPVIQATVPSLSGAMFLIVGFGAIMLARDPNGLANMFFRAVRSVVPTIPALARFTPAVAGSAPAAEASEPVEATDAGEAPMLVTEGKVAHHGVA
jgi:branched-chain amino acid transport system permease protein